jgi:Zn-dependent peptidase ImmA (M78 family)
MARSTTRTKKINHVAYITPSVLTWAIARSGENREKIAARLKVKAEDIARWESGTPPPFKKAEKLASDLRVPFGLLFLSEPPDLSIKLPDMRRLPVSYRQTPNFIELVHDALLRQDWYRDLMRDEEQEPLPFVGRASLRSRVSDVAADIRRTLGIGVQMRRMSKSQTAYLAALTLAVEGIGILVMRSGYVKNNNQRPVSRDEFQGFALADQLAPIVFVNANDFDTAQVFTLIHEVVHIWINKTGISNPSEGRENTNAIETFCNQVTAEVLVPAEEFAAAWRTDSGDGRVERLARRYWVSRHVIINRASDLSLISSAEKNRLKKAIVIPPVKLKRKTEGGPSYFATAAVRAGNRFTDAVTTQVARGRLVIRDASYLLGMSQFSVAKIAIAQSARAS